jgi:cytochrome b6-f complex iron-sulfur subunit
MAAFSHAPVEEAVRVGTAAFTRASSGVACMTSRRPDDHAALSPPRENPGRAGDPRLAADHGRRRFLGTASAAAMAGGLVAGYGALGAVAARFVYPARAKDTGWMFVTDMAGAKVGDAIAYRTPAGETVTVARTGRQGTADDFIALSSTCPHLGCQVKWEPQNNRFFCPCHNGIFDPSGKATGGPPGDAGQSLLRFPLKVEGGNLFIEVPLATLGALPGEVEKGGARLVRLDAPPDSAPGHDPCLGCAGRRRPVPTDETTA